MSSSDYTTTHLGKAHYSNFVNEHQNMTYVSDTHVTYRSSTNYTGEDDYETNVVKFMIQIDNKPVLVTARNSTQRSTNKNRSKYYDGFNLTPNVRYIDDLDEWHYMDETTFTNALLKEKFTLVEGLLEYAENYTKDFLADNFITLIDLNEKKEEKTDNIISDLKQKILDQDDQYLNKEIKISELQQKIINQDDNYSLDIIRLTNRIEDITKENDKKDVEIARLLEINKSNNKEEENQRKKPRKN
jgi:hypothetical protein